MFHIEANLVIGDNGAWHGADLVLRPEPASLRPHQTQRRRWLVACDGYAVFRSSPPAILFVVGPAIPSVALYWMDVIRIFMYQECRKMLHFLGWSE